MKISYSNYPILEKLFKGNLGVVPYLEVDAPFFNANLEAFVKTWKLFQPYFLQDVNVISSPFEEACKKASEKLSALWWDIAKNDTSDLTVNGTFIIKDRVHMVHYRVNKGSEAVEAVVYVFTKDGVPLTFLINSWEYEIWENGWISNSTNLKISKYEIRDFLTGILGETIMLKMFKAYAEVETKELKPNSRLKTVDCKYVNDTQLPLTYLDSKWFTNLVKSDAFTVRGHFRLQPCGQGSKDRKLIWISEFEKSGYTAPARKLSN